MKAGGYKLILSSENESGYKGVIKLPNGNFKAMSSDTAFYKAVYLGTYDTAVAAAVAYAKHVAAKGVYPVGEGQSADGRSLLSFAPAPPPPATSTVIPSWLPSAVLTHSAAVELPFKRVHIKAFGISEPSSKRQKTTTSSAPAASSSSAAAASSSSSSSGRPYGHLAPKNREQEIRMLERAMALSRQAAQARGEIQEGEGRGGGGGGGHSRANPRLRLLSRDGYLHPADVDRKLWRGAAAAGWQVRPRSIKQYLDAKATTRSYFYFAPFGEKLNNRSEAFAFAKEEDGAVAEVAAESDDSDEDGDDDEEVVPAVMRLGSGVSAEEAMAQATRRCWRLLSAAARAPVTRRMVVRPSGA